MRKGGSFIAGEESSEVETSDQAEQQTPAQAGKQDPAPAPADREAYEASSTDTSED